MPDFFHHSVYCIHEVRYKKCSSTLPECYSQVNVWLTLGFEDGLKLYSYYIEIVKSLKAMKPTECFTYQTQGGHFPDS